MSEARKLERLQKRLALSAITFWLMASWGLWIWEDLSVALIFLSAPIASVAAALAIEQLIAAFVSAGDVASPRPLFVQRFHAWWREIVASIGVFCMEQPFRADLYPQLHSTSTACHGSGILLVHGFLCNRGFWNPWRKWLASERRVSLAVTLAPAFVSLDQHGKTLEAAFQQLCNTTGRPPVVVAHSMGGLVVRAWLAERRNVLVPPAIITIGTPHHGAWIARWSRRENGRQMRQGSPWLKKLVAQEESRPYRHRFICLYSNCDNVVFPSSVATLPAAENLHVPGEPHIRLVWSDAVLQVVRSELDRADRAVTG